jgi:CheY-like chemotaxis protein
MSVPESTPAAGARKRVRVLVADDQAVNRKLTMRQLERLGVEVDVAEDGRQALEAMSRVSYDLVFMDCHMPDMDGFEATEEIRRRERGGRGKRTPIIALTGSVVGPDRQRCVEVGMDGYLMKPVKEPELLRVLSHWVADLRPSIDNHKTESLLRITDSPEFLKEIIGIYFSEAPSRINGIRTAIASRDAKLLASQAHALRSSSGNVGATRVVEICTQLESIGKLGAITGAAELFRELQSEYARAESALRQLQQGSA